MFCTGFGGFEVADPSGHQPLRANGTAAWPGWPSSPRLESLRDAWLAEQDFEEQRGIARELQKSAMDELPFIPLGAYWSETALRWI